MATELMRLVDYWLGVPICFLLHMIDYVIRFIHFKKREKQPAKALFIKLSEMGSIILSYTLIKRVKEEYPKSDIFFLTFTRNKPLVETLNIMDAKNILTIREDSPWGFISDTLKVINRMRKEKIDVVFDLELFSRFTAILTYLSGAHKRIGFYRYYFEGLYRGNLLTHKIQYNPLIHTSKSFLSLAQAMKLPEKSTPELKEKIEDRQIIVPRYISSEEQIQQIWYRLKGFGTEEDARLFLTSPGDGIIPSREWPLENFIILIRRFLEETKNYVIIIGTGGVSKKASQILRSINNRRCIDMTNKTMFIELLSLFNIAEALIINDCGLAHIASLAPIKKFVIFGPESPQVYSPLGENTWIVYSDFPCSPCLSTFNHRRSACKDSRCLKAIKPEEVYRLIKAQLNNVSENQNNIS